MIASEYELFGWQYQKTLNNIYVDLFMLFVKSHKKKYCVDYEREITHFSRIHNILQ